MNSPIRVRFAPSPTGHLHIGGLRTALFNWLFARHHGGIFVVRIEDTDVERSRPEFVRAIFDALDWASISSDEPVQFQSGRMSIYHKAIEQLLAHGKAYRCYCASFDRSDAEHFSYPGTCRDNVMPQQGPFVVRIKFPLDRAIVFHDLIRGDIRFEAEQFDDFIVARSDGSPTYNLVVVLDDIDMHISHVIRGEDHISNTPKQLILYEALGAKVPHFAHLPLILGPGGNRLSKRDAATSVLDYKAAGYLPDALCNYLVRLGWSHGDQELFTREELVDYFTLAGVGKKGAHFDQGKLDWMNGMYIREHSSSELLAIILKDVDVEFQIKLVSWSHQQILSWIDLYKPRVKTLRELAVTVTTIHDGAYAISSEDREQWLTSSITPFIQEFVQRLSELPDFHVDTVRSEMQRFCKEKQIKIVQIAQPIRLALTGVTTSPGVFDLIVLLGKQESLRRIKKVLE